MWDFDYKTMTCLSMLEPTEDFMVTGSFESICSPCHKSWPFVTGMRSPGLDQITLLFLQLLKLPWVLDRRGGCFPSCSGSASISTWLFVGHNSQMHSVCGGRKGIVQLTFAHASADIKCSQLFTEQNTVTSNGSVKMAREWNLDFLSFIQDF